MQTPSISIPAGFSTTGMPLGIQLVGQRYADYSLLANASLIAEAIAVPLRQPAFA
jgi:aspartyl-tRNA(Asn)/glutamyl-tRNA(Gln) amidotransferase subunit A